MRQSIVGIGMVKNEEDIIEAFVRHNLHYCDELYILENGSLDTTGVILRDLAAGGLPVTVIDDPSFAYNQSEKITELYRRVLREAHSDFVLPLDADEFIQVESREHLREVLHGIPENGAGWWPWKTYLPADTSRTVIGERFRKCHPYLERRHQKIVVRVPPGKVDDEAVITQGSHQLRRAGQVIDPIPLEGAHLAHLPVRSAQQIAQKVIIGWMANIAHLGEGTRQSSTHWGDLYERVLAAEFRISQEELIAEASRYVQFGERENPLRFGDPSLCLHPPGASLLVHAGDELDTRRLVKIVCKTWESSLREAQRQ